MRISDWSSDGCSSDLALSSEREDRDVPPFEFLVHGLVLEGARRAGTVIEPLQHADHAVAQPVAKALPATGVGDDRGAVETRAEHRGVTDLSAQAAADAAVFDMRDRVLAQRVGIGLDGKRRAAREAEDRKSVV